MWHKWYFGNKFLASIYFHPFVSVCWAPHFSDSRAYWSLCLIDTPIQFTRTKFGNLVSCIFNQTCPTFKNTHSKQIARWAAKYTPCQIQWTRNRLVKYKPDYQKAFRNSEHLSILPIIYCIMSHLTQKLYGTWLKRTKCIRLGCDLFPSDYILLACVIYSRVPLIARSSFSR